MSTNGLLHVHVDTWREYKLVVVLPGGPSVEVTSPPSVGRG